MSKAQDFLQFVNERVRSSQSLLFHGTSSVFLRKILKVGLEPDPRAKVWQEDSDASWTTPSRASLSGAYLTNNVMTAVSSAGNAIRKFGGDRLFVVALIQERSALPDEDNIRGSLGRAVADVAGSGNEYFIVSLYYDILTNSTMRQSSSRDLRERLLRNLQLSGRYGSKMIPDKLAEQILVSSIERQISHLDAGDYRRYMFRAIESSNSSVDSIPPQPNPRDAEYGFQRMLYPLTKAVRAIAVNTTDDFAHTLRMGQGVGYRGKNRIIGVYQELNPTGNRQLKVIFGQPNAEFGKQFTNGVGRFEWTR